MRKDEECAEPIMRHEADVPGVLDEASGRARREAPPAVDAEIRPRENKDRVHVTQHIKAEVDARGDLESAEAIAGRRRQTPGEEEPGADLKKEERNHQRLQNVGAVDVPKHFHHRVVRPFASGEHQVVGDVERQEDHDDGKRRHAVGDAQRRRNNPR